jgi:hypothetical protein
MTFTPEQVQYNGWGILILAFIVWQIKPLKSFVKSMLSERGGGISSKRCIAVGSTIMFLYLCYFSVKYYPKDRYIDRNVLWGLIVVILTSAAIASIPQILQLLTWLRGGKIAPDEATNKDTQN